MKKIFSVASALMLVLSMDMTSCSNNIDEVETMQQAEMHQLHLCASIPQTAETRSFIENVAGKEDAIKITGWKNGDLIYGLYPIVTDDSMAPTSLRGELGKLTFTFNGTTNEFVSESTTVSQDEIKCFVYGDFDFTKGSTDYYYESGDEMFYGDFHQKNPLTIDVANHFTNIPMYGAASVVAEKLSADMQMVSDLAFLCLKNNSSAAIDVRIALLNEPNLYYLGEGDNSISFHLNIDPHSGEDFQIEMPLSKTAAVTKIEAGEKAYLPIGCFNLDWPVQVIINDGDAIPFASKAMKDFSPGMIYKLTYTGE